MTAVSESENSCSDHLSSYSLNNVSFFSSTDSSKKLFCFLVCQHVQFFSFDSWSSISSLHSNRISKIVQGAFVSVLSIIIFCPSDNWCILLKDGDELIGLHCFRHLRDHVTTSVDSINRLVYSCFEMAFMRFLFFSMLSMHKLSVPGRSSILLIWVTSNMELKKYVPSYFRSSLEIL